MSLAELCDLGRREAVVWINGSAHVLREPSLLQVGAIVGELETLLGDALSASSFAGSRQLMMLDGGCDAVRRIVSTLAPWADFNECTPSEIDGLLVAAWGLIGRAEMEDGGGAASGKGDERDIRVAVSALAQRYGMHPSDFAEKTTLRQLRFLLPGATLFQEQVFDIVASAFGIKKSTPAKGITVNNPKDAVKAIQHMFKGVPVKRAPLRKI